jgi:4-hydroxy-tetrahydrodipicolinate reductase
MRVVIYGASGRMGKALLRLGALDARLQIVAAVTGRVVAPGEESICPVYSVSQLEQLPTFDVAIDFSQPEAFNAILDFCRKRKAAFVSGTTGLSELQKQAMSEAANEIPVLWASNFSLGVAVLDDLVRRAAKALETWDVEITEIHHVHKKDAPSGTALSLGQSIELVTGNVPEYQSIREGDVVGDHTVKFSGPGEFIELRHNALDRDIFARGALEAACRLHGKTAAKYQFSDLILGA